MKVRLVSMAFTLMAATFQADAGCVCRCVNGEMKPLCEKTIDLPPICPPTICPLVPPAIAPLDPPKLPPIGTTECKQEQVFNPVTKQYEWRRVCR